MSSYELTRRERSVFNSLVRNFVNSAMPVASNILAKEVVENVSPATIRNVLMNLEKKGLVEQPHISAGRIPTDIGYRYYVNDLMKFEELTASEKNKIDTDLRHVYNENVETILHKACDVLSEISNQLGVVLSPKFYQGIFRKLELVRLSENKLLLVISISSGIVKTIIMEVKSRIQDHKIEQTERIINEKLAGLTLREIRDSIKKRMTDVSVGDKKLINSLTDAANEIFSADNDNIHFNGTSNIVVQPEFTDKDRLAKIFTLIDHQEVLLHILKSSTKMNKEISITIGKEHQEELIRNCSLISTTYKMGDITGTLAVIGPTRMKYGKITSIVDYIAKGINRLFS
ncbi:heat-inducible transcription repressor HrcA [candidate division KSB1 bacterium 4572_119]|nr:MAG: heat-inducible transcription repressor HrcA [candidate division KSB1 bacterium 4572_119]